MLFLLNCVSHNFSKFTKVWLLRLSKQIDDIIANYQFLQYFFSNFEIRVAWSDLDRGPLYELLFMVTDRPCVSPRLPAPGLHSHCYVMTRVWAERLVPGPAQVCQVWSYLPR